MIKLWVLLLVSVSQDSGTVDISVDMEIYEKASKCLNAREEFLQEKKSVPLKASAACVESYVLVDELSR